MTDPARPCVHPWLRVACGVCGEAVDALGGTPAEPAPGSAASPAPGAPEPAQATFIVARGHPELIAQLRALMGHGSGVQVIEDRRRRRRGAPAADEVRGLRKRLRDPGPAG